MSVDVIELRSEGGASGVSGACFGITTYECKHFFDELLKWADGSEPVQGNVESRATRATYATNAQHWFDALLDAAPEPPAAPPPAIPLPKTWRISVPGREPFGLTCIQGTTREALLERYPRGTTVEPIR